MLKNQNKVLTERKKYYCWYTVIFLISFFVVFAVFFLNGRSAVWNADGLTQHYPNLLYFREWAKEILNNIFVEKKFEIPMWDMTLGEGSNVLNVLSFRPLMWLSLLCPGNYLEIFCWVRIMLSLYLAGITFSMFCNKFKKLDFSCLLGALSYVLSGVAVYYFVKHNLFLELYIFLPLLLLGVEKIFRNESAKMFVASVALAGMSYFYNLYIITFFAVLYATIRFIFLLRDRSLLNFGKQILRFGGYYFLGLGLAAISFVPNIALSFSSSRIGDVSGDKLDLVYDIQYYLDLITAPFDTNAVGNYGFLAFSALAVLVGFNLFVMKNNNRRVVQLKLAILIGLVFMCFPVFAFIINGGSITNRWFFAASFVGSLLIAFGFDIAEFGKLRSEHKQRFVAVFIIYTIMCFALGTILHIHLEYLIVAYMFLLICVLCYNDLKHIRRYQITLLILFVLELGYKTYNYYDIDKESNVAQFLEAGTVENTVRDVAASAMWAIEDGNYRVDSVENTWDSPQLNRNYGQRSKTNGLSSYYSYTPSGVIGTLDELGLSQKYQDFAISSYDQRTVLNELSGVEYLTVKKDRAFSLPYGYNYLEEVNGVEIYKNKFALPIVYGYKESIPQKEYSSLSPNQKEQAMLQAAVSDENSLPQKKLEFDYKVLLDKDALYECMSSQNEVEIQERQIVCKGGNQFYIELPENLSGEIYIQFEGLEFESNNTAGEDKADSGLIHAGMNGVYKKSYVFGKNHQYYDGKKDMLINMGYVENFTGSLDLSFLNAGNFVFDNIEVILQPMGKYEDHVDELRIPVSGLQVDDNDIDFDLELEDKRMICVAIPYEKGWSAEINGKSVNIQRVNGRYMGFELEPGDYHIELNYFMPGLKTGAVITLVTIAIIVVLGIYEKRIRRKGKKDV